MTLQALIFDVDGTLADTEEAHRRAFNAAFTEHSLHWFWSRRLYSALLAVAGGKERLVYFIKHLDAASEEQDNLLRLVPSLHASKTQHFARLIQNREVLLREGVEPLLNAARVAGLKLAIASTTSRCNVDELARSALGRESADVFDVIACGDEVAHKKPAPDIYSLALKRLDIAPSSALAFEDSEVGLTAAKAAGLCTIVTPTGWTQNQNFGAADCVSANLRGFDIDALCSLHAACADRTLEIA